MKEITPEIAALCGQASATGSTTTRGKIWTAAVEQQPRQQETQKQAEAGAVFAIPGALGAAPATALAASSAARNGAWTERGSTGSGSWRENVEDTPKVALLSPYLFPVRRQQATFPAAAAAAARGGDVPPVGYQAHDREQQSRRSGHQSVSSAASVNGSGSAAVPEIEAGISHTAIDWRHHPAAAPAAAATAAAVTSTTARQEGLSDGDRSRRITASCSSGEGDDSASGGNAGRPGFVLRQWLLKKPPPVRFPPVGGANSTYSILATSGGGFQRRYATGVEGTNGNAATTKNALAGAAVFFGAARYVYGEETDGSDCDTDAGSAFGDDGSEVEDRGGAAAAVAGRGGSETAQGGDIAQWKNVLLSDAVAEDMWGIQTQDSGNEGEGMWAHRETDAGVGGEQRHGQGEEQGLEGGLEEGDVEEEIEEEEEERKIMAGHKVMAPPPVAEPNQRGKHDRAILMELFDRCHGPTWVGSANWGSEEPLSAWYNVAVDRGGHVQRLTLPRNKLSGENVSPPWALACDHKNSVSSHAETTSVIAVSKPFGCRTTSIHVSQTPCFPHPSESDLSVPQNSCSRPNALLQRMILAYTIGLSHSDSRLACCDSPRHRSTSTLLKTGATFASHVNLRNREGAIGQLNIEMGLDVCGGIRVILELVLSCIPRGFDRCEQGKSRRDWEC